MIRDLSHEDHLRLRKHVKFLRGGQLPGSLTPAETLTVVVNRQDRDRITPRSGNTYTLITHTENDGSPRACETHDSVKAFKPLGSPHACETHYLKGNSAD